MLLYGVATFGSGAAQFVWGFWKSEAGMLICAAVCGFFVACKGPVWSEVVMLIVGPDLFDLAIGYSMVTIGVGWAGGAPAAGIASLLKVYKGVVIIYGRGGGGIPKIAHTQNVPPSIIANYVFAPPPNLCTEIFPPPHRP